MKSGTEGWHPLSKGLHWLIAILILCAWASVEMRELYEKGDSMGQWWEYLHFTVGFSILLLVLLRLYWRATHPRPELFGGRWQRKVSLLVQALLYVLMLAMPITGVAMRQFSGKETPLFWLVKLPPLVKENTDTVEQLAFMHEDLLWNALLALLLLHVSGALWHHFVKSDDTLRHMLPWIK
ncbi:MULTISPECIES: cytochrome b/b6 domain-containing protein [unclassified Microbulbifer]|uniref:cytochrome b n=1 Tax=unclassified Microbulbifer TaxID=2619833 RepID=UPI0027E53E9D|nr:MULTISPECIES: cytochrome b/b6 domain-containing protein [unclassified Microbulbifer]